MFLLTEEDHATSRFAANECVSCAKIASEKAIKAEPKTKENIIVWPIEMAAGFKFRALI